MQSHTFGALIENDSSQTKTTKVLDGPLTRHEVAARSPSIVELDVLRWGERLNGPSDGHADNAINRETTTPTPGELEQSLPPTPAPTQVADAIVQSATNPPQNKWRLASVGLFFFSQGMNDAVVSQASLVVPPNMFRLTH